jgi:hypothetical protein
VPGKVFACAQEWPGWCRSGKDEARAIDALRVAAPRYAVVALEAGLSLPAGAELEVAERIQGDGATAFGVPTRATAADIRPLEADEAAVIASLVGAAWVVFDRVVAAAPAQLRKGPRGGGRDRDQIRDHVLDAEDAYARKIGIRADRATRREALLTALRDPRTPIPEKGWPLRYAARRIAWHALDHAWEIEDKSV